MAKGVYAALSGAVAAETALDTVAQNLANGSSEGYRRLRPVFREEIRDDQPAYLREGTQPQDVELISTGGTGGSPLSVARDAYAKDWWLAESFLLNSWTGLGVGVPYFLMSAWLMDSTVG